MARADGVHVASDGTRIYTYDQAVAEFDALEVPEFSLRDLVLVVLGAQDKPVHGRTLLMNEAFLMHEEALKGRSSDPNFVPYRFGPHSFHVAGLLRELAADGVLEVGGRANSNSESFRLTAKGLKMAAEVLGRLPEGEREAASAKRMGWDQLGTRGVRGYVCKHYPGYEEKSIAKYKDVVWG